MLKGLRLTARFSSLIILFVFHVSVVTLYQCHPSKLQRLTKHNPPIALSRLTLYYNSSIIRISTIITTGYTDAQGDYHPVLQEQFFLPDPDTLIYTHFPFHPDEPSYHRLVQ